MLLKASATRMPDLRLTKAAESGARPIYKVTELPVCIGGTQHSNQKGKGFRNLRLKFVSVTQSLEATGRASRH
jgi:hypothetical protein